MSESHDPVKDAVKNLFGWGKKEEQQPEQTPAEQATQQAAALGEQATAQSAVSSNPFADNPSPVEQSPSYSNPFADHASTAGGTTTSSNPFADHAQSASPAPAEEHPAFESQAVAQNEPAAPASNPDVESINGHAVGYAFLRYYKEHPEIGQPVDEQHGNVGGYQMFENAILHWDGSNVRVEKRGSQGGGQRTYTVNSGDNLSAIAQQVYGDANQWRRIFEANRDKISNPDLIHPGQELVIP